MKRKILLLGHHSFYLSPCLLLPGKDITTENNHFKNGEVDPKIEKLFLIIDSTSTDFRQRSTQNIIINTVAIISIISLIKPTSIAISLKLTSAPLSNNYVV